MPKVKYKDKNLLKKILSNSWIVLLSNLIFQGIRYMSPGEKIYKIFITIIFTLIIYSVTNNIFVSLFFGHLGNYIFNGQFYVVFRYLSSKQVMSRKDLDEYLEFMKIEMKKFNVLDILVIGSFCRGKMSSTSDLDIRIYHKPDIFSSLKAYFMATKLRFYGLVHKFPIDVYCFSDLSFLDKIKKDEIPVNFSNNKDFLKKYPLSVNLEKHMKTLELK